MSQNKLINFSITPASDPRAYRLTRIIRMFIVLLTGVTVAQTSIAQQSGNKAWHFVTKDNHKEFVRTVPEKDGFTRTYQVSPVVIWDVDADNTTYIKKEQTALICFEGQLKNGRKDGMYTAFLIDSTNHQTHYKIWEQTYSGDQLNGIVKTYSLKGNLLIVQTYKNGMLQGISRSYATDGTTLTDEISYDKGVPAGITKKFYPDGVLKDEATVKNGVLNGMRRYYYPSGRIWMEQEVQDDKPWTIIANYTEKGGKRDPGTLKEGNGTIKLYNDDGSVRETITYKNGRVSKQ